VRVCDLRQARYRGLSKTHLQHVVTATAINLYRLDDWWTETPREHTRQSTFAALAA
jgi:transposase